MLYEEKIKKERIREILHVDKYEAKKMIFIGSGKNKKKVYDYPELNGALEMLITNLKAYYKTHITIKMFEYELVK